VADQGGGEALSPESDIVPWLLERARSLGKRPLLLRAGQPAAEAIAYGEVEAAVTAATGSLARPPLAQAPLLALRGDHPDQPLPWLLAAAKSAKTVLPQLPGLPQAVQDQRFEIAGVPLVIDTATGRLTHTHARRTAPSPLFKTLEKRGHAGLVLFSSGTTGEPKGMLHDLTVLLERYRRPDPPSPKPYRIIAFMPFDHIGGFDTAVRAFAGGHTLVTPRGRSPEQVAASIQEHRAQVLPASPSFLNLLLLSEANERYDLNSLEIISFGAEPMPPPLLARLREAFPGASLQQRFGTSETSAITVRDRRQGEDLFIRIEDPQAEARIVEGELQLRTPSRILGYLNADSAALEADGWYRTGDLVEEAENGYFRIIGRHSEVINVGGEKVVPGQVESVLMRYPGVVDCTVSGFPNAITGAAVAASVSFREEPSPHETPLLRRRLRAFCREHLEAFAVPSKIEFVPLSPLRDNIKKTRSRPPG